MKKNGLYRIIVIFFLIVVLHFSSQSQNRKYFIITGKFISGTTGFDTRSIQIVKNNKSIVLSEIPEHGRFRLELEYDSEYQLIFNQKGYLEKKIIVNTKVPAEVLEDENNLPHFLMGVKLQEENQVPANLYIGMQTEQIVYSKVQNCFSKMPSIYDAELVDKGVAKKINGVQVGTN